MHGPPSQSPASKLHWHSNAGLPQPRWLVKKLLPETGVALLSGQWSTGKTFMGLHLANCIWNEETFAGQKIKCRGGTLLFAALYETVSVAKAVPRPMQGSQSSTPRSRTLPAENSLPTSESSVTPRVTRFLRVHESSCRVPNLTLKSSIASASTSVRF